MSINLPLEFWRAGSLPLGQVRMAGLPTRFPCGSMEPAPNFAYSHPVRRSAGPCARPLPSSGSPISVRRQDYGAAIPQVREGASL